MGHPNVDNGTPFTFEPLFLADEELRPLLVPVLKATFDLDPKAPRPTPADEQAPLALAGVRWEEADTSSWRVEPEGAFFKPATDVVLVGHAHAPRADTREALVALRVGPVQKGVRVVGTRVWQRGVASITATRPLPFDQVPLRYERAFGGWDRSLPEPARHSFEPRNPVGQGYRGPGSRFEDGLLLPNLEDPAEPLTAWGQRVTPACFGFTSPEWQPRSRLGGTYDAAWDRTRKPLLPRDFDRRFFNAASPGLVAPGHLRGDEPVVVAGASPHGTLQFALPGLPPPTVRVARRTGQPDATLTLALDTVLVDTDAMQLFLTWRAHLALERDPTEVTDVEVR